MRDRPAFDLAYHVEILCASYQRLTGKSLVPANVDPAKWLGQAPFALVSHDTASDPVFNYANRVALQLFRMTWEEFTTTPSRLSAAPMDRGERAVLLERVTRNGYIDDYCGIRVASDGSQFMIRNATVWNLLDKQGDYYGQAALIPQWEPSRS